MELIFIRHGQGVHNTNIPDRLNYINPPLTDKGKAQVSSLKDTFTFNEEDVFIASPTIRTIETTNILTSNLSNPKKYITPLVGPRMFPLPTDPESYVSKCDWTYPKELIESGYSDFIVMESNNTRLWTEGINTIDDASFFELGTKMISWIKSQITNTNRVFIIAHDGTITNYRKILGEKGLTRDDFLGEAGWHRVYLSYA